MSLSTDRQKKSLIMLTSEKGSYISLCLKVRKLEGVFFSLIYRNQKDLLDEEETNRRLKKKVLSLCCSADMINSN